MCVCVCSVTQSRLTLVTRPPDCSPPDSSVHGILQARILGWVAISSSRGSSPTTDQTCISVSPALADRFFGTTWEAHIITYTCVCVQSLWCTEVNTTFYIKYTSIKFLEKEKNPKGALTDIPRLAEPRAVRTESSLAYVHTFLPRPLP